MNDAAGVQEGPGNAASVQPSATVLQRTSDAHTNPECGDSVPTYQRRATADLLSAPCSFQAA